MFTDELDAYSEQKRPEDYNSDDSEDDPEGKYTDDLVGVLIEN